MIDAKKALAWLDLQRDAVNTEIAYAAPSEQKQYHENLKIINWLAERTQDMTAAEYARAHDEICDANQHCMCESCPLGNNCVTLYSYGDDILRAVEIVKKWKEEHK